MIEETAFVSLESQRGGKRAFIWAERTTEKTGCGAERRRVLPTLKSTRRLQSQKEKTSDRAIVLKERKTHVGGLEN